MVAKMKIPADRLPPAPKPTLPMRADTHSQAIEAEHCIRVREHHEAKTLQEKKKNKVGKPCHWTLDQERKLIRLWKEGHSYSRIAREMGIKVGIAKHRVFNLQQQGVLERRHKSMPLTSEQQEEILRLRRKGYTQRQIGDAVGVARSTVQDYLRRTK